MFSSQLNKDNTVYPEELRNESLEVLSALENPLVEEKLNDAADHVYGKGYNHDNQVEYNEGLDCIQIKDMVAGTNQDWVEDIIRDNEGSVEILPKPLVDEYNIKKKEGLIIEALGLCVPVGNWRLAQLFRENRINKSHDPWILIGCRYSPKLGLEIHNSNDLD